MLFHGWHVHAIDNKGRVSIPSGYRMELLRLSGEKNPMLMFRSDHLALFPYETWESFVNDSLQSKSRLQPNVQRLNRYLLGNSFESPIDGQGRILIPTHLRDEAGLKQKVVFVGVADMVEIWNVERYQQEQGLTKANYSDIQVSVDRLEPSSTPPRSKGETGGP
jgi:MraZ protein